MLSREASVFVLKQGQIGECDDCRLIGTTTMVRLLLIDEKVWILSL